MIRSSEDEVKRRIKERQGKGRRRKGNLGRKEKKERKGRRC